MMPVRLDWTRCPDGVELVNAGRKVTYRPRTERRVPVVYDVANLEDTVAVRFMNTAGTDTEKVSAFLGRFGMLFDEAEVTAEEVDTRHGLLSGLLVHGTETQADLAKHMNMCLAEAGTVLKPSFDITDSGAARVAIGANNLMSLMAMELAFAAEAGAEATVCDHCGTVYLTGPLTGRRSHSKFCSDRCRVAAMRERNREVPDGSR